MPYKDKNNRLEYYKKYYETHKEQHSINGHKTQLKLKHNMTVDEYNKLLINQDFKCALCDKHVSEFKNRLSVDHCHDTGRIRGLLCFPCNTSLGQLGDTEASFEKVLKYIKNPIVNTTP